MGKSTKRLGFSCSNGSSASSGLSVEAIAVFSTGLTSTAPAAWMPLRISGFGIDASQVVSTGAFSLPSAKLIFLIGDSFILRLSIADAACVVSALYTTQRITERGEESFLLLWRG